ncbi:MAG: hypothetical protein GY715_09175 [Planctomycetes bacterium]|nr:hypothetical protein [Planctomycetota bacterium]
MAESDNSPILELRGVNAPAGDHHDVGLEALDLALRAGELALVTVGLGRSVSPLADVAQGLVEPASGTVRFLGEDWAGMDPQHGGRMRARTGRVFARGGWLSDLDMDENITLRQRHHGGGTLRAARADALGLARRFGIGDLLRKRPAQLNRHELHVTQWVRALLADPALIILERPTRDVQPEAVPLLVEAIGEERARGAAVLWITENPERPGPSSVEPDQRLTLHVPAPAEPAESEDHEASVQVSVRP